MKSFFAGKIKSLWEGFSLPSPLKEEPLAKNIRFFNICKFLLSSDDKQNFRAYIASFIKFFNESDIIIYIS